jgi:L-histidine Nalpha-methyltransferase
MPRATVTLQRTRSRGDDRAEMAAEIRAGLSESLPTIPSKYFYDDRGSRLFDEITRLPEYYQTRTEEAILESVAPRVVAKVRPSELVELGSGASRKVRILLDAMAAARRLEACVLFDINESDVRDSVAELAEDYPEAEIRGVVGDFTAELTALGPGGGRLLAFLGSTIGNLHPSEVPEFLRRTASVLEPADAFLLGVDLVKDIARVEAAYNDTAGITAEFNRNILRVLNERLGANFEPDAFEHVAFYDTNNAWIEMRLRATKAMKIQIPPAGLELDLAAGDMIRTEISCKYTRESLERLLEDTGLVIGDWFMDRERLFAVALLRPQSRRRRS